VPSARTVGAVARLAGVSVRTLHHYDEIGLLTPSDRSDAGYRRYADGDLDRLQRILFYRELGLGLDDIRTVMTDGRGDASVHLRRQHALLLERIERLKRMATAVEKALEARTMGISLTPEERFENHKNGIKCARVVRDHGERLVPRLYAHLNPMTFERAVQMEAMLADLLRKRGFVVFGGH